MPAVRDRSRTQNAGHTDQEAVPPVRGPDYARRNRPSGGGSGRTGATAEPLAGPVGICGHLFGVVPIVETLITTIGARCAESGDGAKQVRAMDLCKSWRKSGETSTTTSGPTARWATGHLRPSRGTQQYRLIRLSQRLVHETGAVHIHVRLGGWWRMWSRLVEASLRSLGVAPDCVLRFP